MRCLRWARLRAPRLVAPWARFCSSAPAGVTAVRCVSAARRAAGVLRSLDRCVAWDTETCDVDVKKTSPVTHGGLLAASAYAGKDVDFGNGPRLVIDGTVPGVLEEFREYFESASAQKVFHNYAFDAHVLLLCFRRSE